MRAYIGLGSNIGDGPGQLRQALRLLASRPGIELLRVSSFYRTAPWGRPGQADFTNAVAEIGSELEPLALLGVLLETERVMGRERGSERWGPRCIDLDLLCYGTHRQESEILQLPHPRMHQRAFVLVPLLELEPGFTIPGMGAARSWLEKLESQDIQKM